MDLKTKSSTIQTSPSRKISKKDQEELFQRLHVEKRLKESNKSLRNSIDLTELKRNSFSPTLSKTAQELPRNKERIHESPKKTLKMQNLIETYNSQFPYNPTISVNSKKIAQTIGSPEDRMLRSIQRKIKRSHSTNITPKGSSKKLPQIKKSLDECDKISQRFYNEAMYSIQKKNERARLEKEKRIEEEQIFSFKPDLTLSKQSSANTFNNYQSKSTNQSIDSMYKKTQQWARRKDSKNKLQKDTLEEKSFVPYTFYPETNQGIMADDLKTINMEITYINNYAEKRQKMLKMQKEVLEKENRRMFGLGYKISDRNVIKNTQQLQSGLKKNNSKKDLNFIRSLTPKRVLSQRQSMGISDFFNNNNNINNSRNINTSIRTYDEVSSEKQFSAALKNIHEVDF
jgi:hypothetical protein